MSHQTERRKPNFLYVIIATVVIALTVTSCIHASSTANPTKTEQGLALAYAGCLAGEMDKSKKYSLSNLVYFRPETIFGGVNKVEIAQGVTWKVKQIQDYIESTVAWSDYAIQTFTMASTIDSHWSRLSTLLNSAINAGVESWNQTHQDLYLPTSPFENQELQLYGICKVVNLQVFSYSKQRNLSPRDWTLETVGQYLPPV